VLWLEAISRWKGTFTAAPDFAFRMAVQRSLPGDLDLSALRCVIVGGEIVRADTLSAFTSVFCDHGFPSVAFCPAYGMAELGLAATLTPPDHEWRDVSVSSAALADQETRSPDRGEAKTTLVASGTPLPGYAVAAGTSDHRTGQIAVRGPSVGLDGITKRGLADANGWFSTGDTGFLVGDWLYVCGRADDYVVAHGRNIYAPAIEAAVGEAQGVRAGRVTVLDRPTGEWVIVAEPADISLLRGAAAKALLRDIRRAAVDVAQATPDDVVLVAPGDLPLTSSGKLQRSQVRRRLLMGELAGANSTDA
jgi:fatty-acyl-CoA synthase